MDFQSWEPYYLRILQDFSYDPAKDVESAKALDALFVARRAYDEKHLRKKIGKELDICGNAAVLETELDEEELVGPIVSAGSATATLMEYGILPSVLFSDLDGDVDAEIEANANGTIAVILAHGDNKELVERFVPQFPGWVMPTCQCAPFGQLRNYGGFTDGDRAVMTARHLGATTIRLHGFDFTEPRPKPGSDPEIKLRKLEWAKRIIYELNPAVVRLVDHG